MSMPKKDEDVVLDVKQIEEERRDTLELILIVVVLGLLLNYIASGIYGYFDHQEWGYIVFWVVLIVAFGVLAIYILGVLLRPARKHLNVPIVFFYDNRTQTISVPKEIHHPSKFRIPFPILSRLYFDKYKDNAVAKEIIQLDFENIQTKLLVDLIQFLLIEIYSEESFLTWAPVSRISVGPFITGQQKNAASEEYKRAYLASLSSNEFLKMSENGRSLMLPPKTRIDFPSLGHFRLYGALFEVDFKVNLVASQPLYTWKYARGTISSWHRELSSDFKDTSAFLYYLKIDFVLKKVFWRIFAENWLPPQIRPEPTIGDICDWINSWFSLAFTFFNWVDEDMHQIPDSELAVLVDEARLEYQPKVSSSSGIMFKN